MKSKIIEFLELHREVTELARKARSVGAIKEAENILDVINKLKIKLLSHLGDKNEHK